VEGRIKMPMTPDEVVDNLEKLNTVMENVFWKGQKEHPEKTEFITAISSAISLLQDYQKLREKIDVDELSFLIYKYETGLGEELARANWTAKHFQDKSKINSTPLAEQIVTYLQQPTEPIER
jgi:hypothetical protein